MRKLTLAEIFKPHKLGVVFITLLLTLPSSCKVTFVPSYSEAIEKQIIETQKMNEKLYNDIKYASLSNREFENFEKQYSEIESNINSLVFQMHAREKNIDFLSMADNLKMNFLKYKKEHLDLKVKGKKMTDGEADSYIDYIQALYDPMLKAEKVLKNTK